MEILRGLPLPRSRVPPYASYDFDQLKHGDAIRVTSVNSAREMFRRWKRRNPDSTAHLVRHDDPTKSDILFFIEDKPGLKVKRAPSPIPPLQKWLGKDVI